MVVRSVGRRTLTLLVLAAIAGVLLAGLMLPIVGGIGLAAKASGNQITKIGSCPTAPPLPQHSVLLADNGTVLATLSGPEDRVVVQADAIPAVMQYAIVAIEDNRFFEHKGVDLRGLIRAASADTSAGGYSQGASTITEQYVKLAQVELAEGDKVAQQAATEKSLDRKLTDARCAIALEKKLSKQQILTDYLNIAYFGEGIYGVGTAAEHYFGVPVRKLTLAQAALLAGLVNNPTEFDPVQHPQAAGERRAAVLDAVARYHLESAKAVAVARATPLVVHPVAHTTDSCTTSVAPLFCEAVKTQLLADPKLGSTQAARTNTLFEGGLDIHTTYDPTIQAATNAGIAKHLPDDIRQVSASVSIQPGTGYIQAIGQNRQFGRGTGQLVQILANSRVFNVGSTFKLMTLTAAVEQGIPLGTRINSPACYHYPGGALNNPPGDAHCKNGFSNAGDGEACDCDLYTGTWDSVNTFYVQLELKVGGPTAVAEMARRLGIVGSPQFQSGDVTVPALTLGSGGFSPVDMATAYATIAAHGLACTPTTVSRITTLTGAPVPFTASTCKQVVSAHVADTVTSILQGVLDEPHATGARLGIGRPAAGKTGTVDAAEEGWFVGYTPQLATAVGVFDPLYPTDPNHPATPITDLSTGHTFYQNDFFGASVAGPIWRSIMELALQAQQVEYFALPQGADTAPSPSTSPSVTPSTSTSTSPSAPTPTGGITITITPPGVTPSPKPKRSHR